MAVDDMLDDGEAKPRAAGAARAAAVHAVETFGEAGDVLGRNAGAVVLDGDEHARAARQARAAGAAGDGEAHGAALATVAQGVLKEVAEDLSELLGIGGGGQGTGLQ